MSTSCISFRNRDLWLNDIDIAVSVSLMHECIKNVCCPASVSDQISAWSRQVRGAGPGCIALDFESICSSPEMSLALVQYLKSVLKYTEEHVYLLDAERMANRDIVGVRFTQSFPIEAVRDCFNGMIGLLNEA